MTIRDELCASLRAHTKEIVDHAHDLMTHGEAEYARALDDAANWCDAFAEMNELNPSGVAYLFVADALRDGTVKRLADEARPEMTAKRAAEQVRKDRHTEATERLRVAEEDSWREPLARLVGDDAALDWGGIYAKVRIALEAQLPDHVKQCLVERAQLCAMYDIPGDRNTADHVDRIVEQLQKEREIMVEEEISRRVAETLAASKS